MCDMMILAIVLGYFCLLFAISRWTGRHADNDTFYRGNRQSPWYMVAFGMIGASISGVTFVSVPGMVTRIDMTYLQTCMGFILGYVIVAFVLLPLYYRLNLTTIYSFLGQRIGRRAYRTGASFFLLSKMTGAWDCTLKSPWWKKSLKKSALKNRLLTFRLSQSSQKIMSRCR